MEEEKDCHMKCPERVKGSKTSEGEAVPAQETDIVHSIEDDHDEDEDDYNDYIAPLPKELRKLRPITFRSQNQLEEELIKRGFSDLTVEVHPKTGKAHLKITSGAHDAVTSYYAGLFNDDYKPLWGVAVAGSTNVFMQPTSAGGRLRRKPDIAFFGPDKCHRPQRTVVPRKLVEAPLIFQKTREQTENVNPDVVVQISWGNSEPYDDEFEAINDLMNHALVTYPHHAQPNNDAPALGFLIKIRVYSRNKRTQNKRKIIRQIDIYRLPRGTTAADAQANRNGASYSKYVPGGPDVAMEITAADLGVVSNSPNNNNLPPFYMSAKEMYDQLK